MKNRNFKPFFLVVSAVLLFEFSPCFGAQEPSHSQVQEQLPTVNYLVFYDPVEGDAVLQAIKAKLIDFNSIWECPNCHAKHNVASEPVCDKCNGPDNKRPRYTVSAQADDPIEYWYEWTCTTCKLHNDGTMPCCSCCGKLSEAAQKYADRLLAAQAAPAKEDAAGT